MLNCPSQTVWIGRCGATSKLLRLVFLWHHTNPEVRMPPTQARWPRRVPEHSGQTRQILKVGAYQLCAAKHARQRSPAVMGCGGTAMTPRGHKFLFTEAAEPKVMSRRLAAHRYSSQPTEFTTQLLGAAVDANALRGRPLHASTKKRQIETQRITPGDDVHGFSL